MRLVVLHQHQGPDILKEIKRGGSRTEWGIAIMSRVYSLSTSTGKVMESGLTADWSTAAGGQRDRHKLTDRQTEPHTKRLEPCSSIWPGQIRLQHSGIYQVPQYRCITWTAERSPSHLLIVYSICGSVFVRVCVWISVSNTCVLIFPFICECECVCLFVCYHSAQKPTARPRLILSKLGRS